MPSFGLFCVLIDRTTFKLPIEKMSNASERCQCHNSFVFRLNITTDTIRFVAVMPSGHCVMPSELCVTSCTSVSILSIRNRKISV